MSEKNFEDLVITKVEPAITAERVEAFRAATHTQYTKGIPITFPTIFRTSEFELLYQMGEKLDHLLHTDQEYEFLLPLKIGDIPESRTRAKEVRERKARGFSLKIFTFESDIVVAGKVAVKCFTTTVIREPLPEGDSK